MGRAADRSRSVRVGITLPYCRPALVVYLSTRCRSTPHSIHRPPIPPLPTVPLMRQHLKGTSPEPVPPSKLPSKLPSHLPSKQSTCQLNIGLTLRSYVFLTTCTATLTILPDAPSPSIKCGVCGDDMRVASKLTGPSALNVDSAYSSLAASLSDNSGSLQSSTSQSINRRSIIIPQPKKEEAENRPPISHASIPLSHIPSAPAPDPAHH